jgi:hypothetical protein
MPVKHFGGPGKTAHSGGFLLFEVKGLIEANEGNNWLMGIRKH